MSLINNSYFESRNVKVYPAAFRGNYSTSGDGQYQFDPEARIPSEYNLLRSGGALSNKASFIVSYDTGTTDHGNVLKCVIGGYYFELYNVNLDDFNANGRIKTLGIALTNLPLNETNTDGKRESKRLTSRYGGQSGSLDALDSSTNKYFFTGILVSDSDDSADAVLQPVVLDKDNKVQLNYEAFLPQIKAGLGVHTASEETSVTSIEVGVATKALGDSAIAGGAKTVAVGKNSLAIGERTAAFGDSSIASGEGSVQSYTVTKIDSNANKISIDNTTGLRVGDIVNYGVYYFKVKSVDSNYIIIDQDTNISKITANATIYKITGVANKGAVAENYAATASGIYSHAEGWYTTASGESSRSEGKETIASGAESHAEGYATQATSANSHAEGYQTIASGACSHAEGKDCEAKNEAAHAEGNQTTAEAKFSHTEGVETKVNVDGTGAHAEGYKTIAKGLYSHAEGESDNTTYINAEGQGSHSEGYKTKAKGNYSHSEGYKTIASGVESHAEGHYTKAEGHASHAEGGNIVSDDTNTQIYNVAQGNFSHVEGTHTIAAGESSHAEGIETKINSGGNGAHTEGYKTIAAGFYAHAEGESDGDLSNAVGQGSHSEGYKTQSAGMYSHAEGKETIARGMYAHSSGYKTEANGANATALGSGSVAEGACSLAAGTGTIAKNENEVVIGKYNAASHDNKLFVVGDGADDTNRKDALSFASNSTKTIKVGADRAERTLGYDLNINGIELLDIIKSQLLDSLYPVGSIYTCTTDAKLDSNKTCPIQVALGGKWVRITDTFLYAGKDNTGYKPGNAGGSKDAAVVEHTHNLKTGAAVSVYEETLKGTIFTGRGENGRYLHALSDNKKEGDDGIISLKNGYSTSSYTDPKFTMQEVQLRPLQWQRPDKIEINATHSHSCTVTQQPEFDAAGESGAGKNMPPYICVYMWKRVADDATITSNSIGLRPGLQNGGNLGNITIKPPFNGSGINSDKI